MGLLLSGHVCVSGFRLAVIGTEAAIGSMTGRARGGVPGEKGETGEKGEKGEKRHLAGDSMLPYGYLLPDRHRRRFEVGALRCFRSSATTGLAKALQG